MQLAEVPRAISSTLSSSAAIHLNGYASPVAQYLPQLDERIFAQARAFDPLVMPYVEYALQSHGKGLRPTLALLCAQVTGGVTDAHLDLAVAVELIHLASLVHDDIIDGATQRRSQPTAVSKWGAELSVLLGDCLFAHALKICTNLPAEVNREISAAVVEVCSGEIMQTQRRFDLTLSLEDYTKIIGMKTGALFRVPCLLAAKLNEAAPAISLALENYGKNLGIAYQIYDDCLDLVGSEVSAGKTLGTDLERGKVTLPVLYLLNQAVGEDHERICAILLHGSIEEKEHLLQLIHDRGTLRQALDRIHYHLEICSVSLDQLPESPARESLREIPTAITDHVQKLTMG